MGRPERPIENRDHALGQFAADLRRLRRLAGSPAYREMARRAHYSASVLSQAASGRTLPTLAVTLAFVRACDGPSEQWALRWREVAGAPDDGEKAAQPVDPPHLGTDTVDLTEASSAAAPELTGRTRRAAVARRIAIAVTGAGLATALALAATHSPLALPGQFPSGQESDSPPAPDGVPASGGQVVDGADPKQTGCAADAVTLDSRGLVYPKGRLAGTVELRYSPRCHMGWTRFSPAPATGRGPGDTVTVEIVRPADGVRLPFTMTYGDL